MDQHRYSTGGIVRDLIEGVAREAPELSRGISASSRRAAINIGLDINGGERLHPDQVLEVLGKMGVKPVRAIVAQSDTEPTLVVELERALKPDEAHYLSDTLRQEAIAQVDEAGNGDLYGPAAEKWKPFNGDYFIAPSGKRLTQAIMDAGSGEKPGYGKGGMVKKAVEGLADAIGIGAQTVEELTPKAQRLYHGTTKLPSDSKFGYWGDLMRDQSRGFDYLSPDVRGSQLGLHLGNQKQADYFASGQTHLDDVDILLNKEHYSKHAPSGGRIAPLDVTLKNPLRLEDRTGSWYPSEIYDQLTRLGKVENNSATWSALKQLEEGSPEDRKQALESVRRMIEDAGHDGVVYTNRVEGFTTEDPIRERFKKRGFMDESRMRDEDWLDVVPEAKGNDSYIVWNKDQYKSPFGDGPGVGFAGGGLVEDAAEWLAKYVKRDNPATRGQPGGAEWLARNQEHANAARNGRALRGPDTAWAHGIDIPVEMLAKVPGANGEVRVPGDPKYDDLLRRVQEEGWQPEGNGISVAINHRGEPFIYEGNTRTAVARALGLETIPGDIHWLNGAEMGEHDWTPEKIAEFLSKRKQGFANGGAVRKLGQGLIDLLDFSGVAGRPRTVKIPGEGEFAAAPIGEIDDAAEAYMKKAGIPGTHRIGEYPEFDEDFARRIAKQYDELQHNPSDPEVKRAYEALLDETMGQYRALEDTGLDIKFLKDGMDDPYARSPSLGYADMVKNGRLWVFPTSQGYGSGADVFEHPLLKKVGRVGDLEDATANDAFRVVHDAFGHFGPGNPFFRAPGEDRAWMHHSRMYSDDALPAMSAETRGQNSWVNSGPKAEANRGASGADTIYADQKAVAMPSWVYERDLGRKPKFADGGSVLSDDQLLDAMLDEYQNRDITNYEATRDAVAKQPADTQSMTHVGAKPRRPVTMETFGKEINLGDAPYDVADSMSTMAQTGNEAARMGIYAVPGVGPFIGAGLDTAEAVATDDPTSAGMAVAFGPGGKYAKAAVTSALAMGMDPAEAEAGIYGTLAKWAQSREGQSMLGRAIRMERAGEDPELIRGQTMWFKDHDGRWKFELPSAGSKADLSLLKGGRLDSFYYDPHLFDQHPEMAGLKVRRVRDEGAYYDPHQDYIGIGDISSDYFKRPEIGGAQGIVAHEVYHKKAFDEGWPAKGSNDLLEMGRLRKDAERFANYQHLDPAYGQAANYLDTKILNSPTNTSGLAGARYSADLGEVLARREGRRRNLTEDMIRMGSPLDDIDMPMGAIFDNSKLATPDQYRELINYIKQRKLEGKGMP